MKLNGILDVGLNLGAVQGLLAELAGDGGSATPLGLCHAARPYLVGVLAGARKGDPALDRPILVVSARANRARQWVDELRTWLPDEVPVHHFADPDALPYERIAWAPETRQRRLEAIVGLVTSQQGWAIGGPGPETGTALAGAGAHAGDGAPAVPRHHPVVVASVRALMQKTLPVREMRAAMRPLAVRQLFDMKRALATWIGLGYESAAVVEIPGTFSRRGGIIDVWPPNLRRPLRIELFGDEVDSLRAFDPSTQRTLNQVDQLWAGPASEALPKVGSRSLDRLQALDLAGCHPPARTAYEEELRLLASGSGFRHLEWYLPYLYSQPASLLDYLPAGAWLVLDDAGEINSMLNELAGQAEQLAADLSGAGDVPGHLLEPYFSPAVMQERLAEGAKLNLGHTTLAGWHGSTEHAVASVFVPGPRYAGQVRNSVREIAAVMADGGQIVIVTRQAQRLGEIWSESHPEVLPVQDVTERPQSALSLVEGVMDEGWILRQDDARPEFWFLTDAELFGWGKPKPRRSERSRATTPDVFFADVAPGDYVVHMEHGIGRFVALVKRAFEGNEREYLQVDYSQGDRLYVPVHQADRLSRYVGSGDGQPALHRLGSSDWEQLKARTRKAVAEIANELLALYAAREVVRGHAFSPDAPWQAELEASFPYVETEDQLVAIEAVKHDMEQRRPMDRLICGDVGYGKTEVALRAAFKAIMDSKQVAVLVPTTVLAQQHFTNFVRRLASFPVNVSMLSRFETPAEQQKTLEGLLDGSIDLVVGTHRLLSNDVAFKDLGLLIVDEEQRFGVAHKERIKQMRTEVDVLTLTATPIPRTLYMSLSGVRDLSTIDTPPEERLPIKTTLAEFDETLIRQAALREMDRGGQIYFVHNRVQGIEQIAARLNRIVPEARIAIGHGQMPERELSSVMLAFSEGQYDMLVCTSIIESGLDIPNANTILINRADQFGLAQLYQLRGRVGRSAVRAYAYLLVDKYSVVTEDARRRLEAIEEASDLGAGFRIAMHDLEIRGAGELLGARQHGHIAAVGFDLYTRLLSTAVREAQQRMRNDVQKQAGAAAASGPLPHGDTRRLLSSPEPAERDLPASASLRDPLLPAVTLDLSIPASLPDTYVPDAGLRLQLYRRLAGLTSLPAISEMSHELGDRFGPLPEEAGNLLFVVRMKVLAIGAGVDSIGQEDGQLVLKGSSLEQLDQARIQRKLREQSIPARLVGRTIWLPHQSSGAWREDLERTLGLLIQSRGEKTGSLATGIP